MTKYYNINGIPGTEESAKSVLYEWNNQFSIKENDNTTNIDFKLIEITQNIAAKMFGSYQDFYNILITKTTIFPFAGVDAEIKISKREFETWLNSESSIENNKLLYYYDLQSLIGSLQNLIQESRILFCDFYKTLNENSFMLSENPINPSGVMFASGQLVTTIFSRINHLFINLASQLDFITKISIELENIPTSFNEYPKLKSKKIQYSNLNKIKNLELSDTVFEKTDDIKLILSLRNEIVHNASFENIPKVYQVFKENKMIEKFIFVPDYTNGNFDSYKNRNRFFNNEVKLNELLPILVTEFWKKMELTIDRLK